MRLFRSSASLPRRPLLVLVLLLALPLLAACDVADQPDGWGAPTPDPMEPETRLLVPTGDDRVIAVRFIDQTIGTAAWQFPDDDNRFPGLDGEIDPVAFYADPVWSSLTDEWLLAGYQDGAVYAVQRDGESARVLFRTDARIVANLILDDDRIYIADTGYRVHAVGLEQPEETIWSWDGDTDQQIWAAPALVETSRGRLLVVAGLDGRVTALTVDGDEPGTVAWSFELDAAIAGSLAAEDGIVYVGGFDRVFYALDAASGALIWSAKGSHWFWSTPLIHEGTIFVADLRGNVYAWDARNGAARWLAPYEANERIRTQPLIAARGEGAAVLILVSRDGTVHQLSASDGTALRRFTVSGAKDLMANAILRDDRILVSDEDGSLYAVLLGANQAERLWPQG